MCLQRKWNAGLATKITGDAREQVRVALDATREGWKRTVASCRPPLFGCLLSGNTGGFRFSDIGRVTACAARSAGSGHCRSGVSISRRAFQGDIVNRSSIRSASSSQKKFARTPRTRIALGLACALGLTGAPSRAGGPPPCIEGTLVTYAATDGIAQYNVPASATELRVEMTGASGGDSTTDRSNGSPKGQVNFLGGQGVHVITIFQVAAPLALEVLAGGQGGQSRDPGFGAGGGGGSFLFTPGGELYLAAAGGGGGGATQNGQDGSFSAAGGSGGGPTGGAGGTNGLGGEAGGEKGSNAGGGAGFLGAGGDGAGSFSGLGGHRISSPGDAAGGHGSDSGGDGGFGGGGGGAGPSGGGGGGYSGGGTGFGKGVDGGGAGGTFIAAGGATFVMEPAAIPGPGSVAICVSEQEQGEPVEVPALSTLGLAALAALVGLVALARLSRVAME